MQKTINIIGISSSPKYDGNTATLVRKILKGAENHGAQINEYHLPQYNINYCQGCFHCMRKGYCIIDDDFTMIQKMMLSANGIVIGSPTYGLAPNAMMKNFLDRIGMFAVYTSSLKDKYIIGVSTCGKFGAKKTAKQLTDIVNGIWGSGKKAGIISTQIGWGIINDNEDILKKAFYLGERIVKDIQNERSYWYKDILSKIVSSFIMRPAMKKNILANKNDDMKGVYEHLKSRGLIE